MCPLVKDWYTNNWNLIYIVNQKNLSFHKFGFSFQYNWVAFPPAPGERPEARPRIEWVAKKTRFCRVSSSCYPAQLLKPGCSTEQNSRSKREFANANGGFSFQLAYSFVAQKREKCKSKSETLFPETRSHLWFKWHGTAKVVIICSTAAITSSFPCLHQKKKQASSTF